MKNYYKIVISVFLIILSTFGLFLIINKREFKDGKKRLICESLVPPIWDYDKKELNYKSYKIIEFNNNDEVVLVNNRIVIDYNKKESYLMMANLYKDNIDLFYLNFNINHNMIKVEERELEVKFDQKKYMITINNVITRKDNNKIFFELETKNFNKYEDIKKILKSSYNCD